ncbi:polynucleotide 5'-hydroxyl-kinase grc3 [Aspergillus ellipticus CBS 707.79]|uniref:Polynucleotide 5'-hydroxyl-kinase GRC3 n=1 Tax=Aspergillus ellipticus CBS 707.79 TaxID=1448320 RepID=A0A319EYP3_9EURO|nr:polynucleotide 5'-hydroxyl-kinase grc3 [Aspergillus ellipticus CBS 707.79]
MKRKAEKSQSAAPVSAFAARKARQQQAQAPAVAEKPNVAEPVVEPPPKRARRSLEQPIPVPPPSEENQVPLRRSSRRTEQKPQNEKATQEARVDQAPKASQQVTERGSSRASEVQAPSDEESEEQDVVVNGSNGVGLEALEGDVDGYESPADTPVQVQDFPLSKTRLNKSSIVYSDEHRLCVRIREKMSLVMLGHYDVWVKRGVISLMGAKLHPSSRVYRVYAPSTHSLPVIKCIAGVNGEAEVEFKSCHSGIYRLKDLSPLYQRIWNGKNTTADKLTLKGASPSAKRTFSVLYTSADDSLKRHLRPLHLEKQWSSAIKSLSQRGGRLKTLICGPKGSGKSTFSRYLLNHLLSPAPQTETNYCNTDGVAFLDLDPGQPEFAPMGQVYLVHLRSPVFGPPFTHPSLDGSRDGSIVRAHHIGATSPKEDSDHYVLAAMDLMERYRALQASYPQCPLIINYPGWIFGLGLEVATYLVRSLGLSDVVYMSEKGPAEVVEPLGQAAYQAKVPLTILPSQPTDFVNRSSAQLRSMQMQSYFHMSRPSNITTPLWLEKPLSRTNPFHVHYSGPKQGIQGVMVMGTQINPDLLHEVLDGSIVAVVAVESPNAILGQNAGPVLSTGETDSDHDINMGDSTDNLPSAGSSTIESSITRTPKEDLPYLFVGSGSSNPLDPKVSHCLGLALVRSVNVASRQLELVTPITGSTIRGALEQGHGIVLVRGLLDNPNWAISEDYHSARAAEKRHRELAEKLKKNKDPAAEDGTLDAEKQMLRDRIRRASNVPWMTVVEDNSRRHREAVQREKSLWKLRKKAYPGSDSEGDW